MQIMVDSAALYTISVYIFFMAFLLKSNSTYIVSAAVSIFFNLTRTGPANALASQVVQIIGINFNLMICRVDAGKLMPERAKPVFRGNSFRRRMPWPTQRNPTRRDTETFTSIEEGIEGSSLATFSSQAHLTASQPH
jgi:hypothetical protein